MTMDDTSGAIRGARSREPGAGVPGRLLAVVLAGAVLLAGCDDESLMPPEPEGGDIFRNYVALGASITAGFQSGGINDSTQLEAYPVKLAERMGTAFDAPLLRSPGCPPPFTDILAGERVAGGTAETCALRDRPIPEQVDNLAVPGAEVGDLLENLGEGSNANALTQFILGGRTQVEAAVEAEPTFVTVFAGGNDILDAITAGDPALATSAEQFAADYGELASRLQGVGAQGVVLIGIPNVLDFSQQGVGVFPHLSVGAAYFQASQSPAWPDNFDVNNNCAPESVFADGQPGEESLVPFGYGFGQLFAAAQQGQSVELDCLNDDPILVGAEALALAQRLAAYNGTIQTIAQENGWLYVDPTQVLLQARADGLIPPFPTIDDPATPIFGPFYSQDGIHLAEPGHEAVADFLAQRIDEEFGTSITGQ